MYIVSKLKRNRIYKVFFWIYIIIIGIVFTISILTAFYQLHLEIVSIVLSVLLFTLSEGKNNIVEGYLDFVLNVSEKRIALYEKMLLSLSNISLTLSIASILFSFDHRTGEFFSRFMQCLFVSFVIAVFLSLIQWCVNCFTSILMIDSLQLRPYFQDVVSPEEDELIKTFYVGFKAHDKNFDKPIYDDHGNIVGYKPYHWKYTVEERISLDRERYYYIYTPSLGLSPNNFNPQDFKKIYLSNPLFKKNIPILVFDDKENTNYALANDWICDYHDRPIKRMMENFKNDTDSYIVALKDIYSHFRF